MKIGIIDVGWKKLSREMISDKALGGSETWLIRTSQELGKTNEVTVFCNTDQEWVDGGTTFKSLYYIIDTFNKKPHYDFIILNRIIHNYNTDFITLIRQYNVTDNIFIQMHDLSLLYEDHIATREEINKTGIFDKRVRGMIFLTEWHKKNFESQYPELNSIPKYIIPNGVDLDLIPTKKEKTDNRILWSSCAERGLDILIDMYDDIKKEIPDFGIDVAGYNDLSKLNVQGKDVKILGNLSKKQLYEEMNKHKVWFYPGTFAETFCITMVENMLCKNFVISPFTYGTQDIPHTSTREKIRMCNNFLSSKTYEDAKQEAIGYIINALTHVNEGTEYGYDQYDQYIEQCYQWCSRYTWNETAHKYTVLFKCVTYKHISVEHKYKGIFLSQSANIDFFKTESDIVEQTWAKDLINNKYPEYCYFRYTSCDDQHVRPCIDGNTIYVSNDDSLGHTYEKMRDVYRLLREEGYDFDYIFRTNTSTYINIDKAIEAIESTKINEIKSDICGYYHVLPGGERIFQFNCFTGNAYIMSSQVADRIFLSRYDSSISDIKDGDDIIATMIINELTNQNDIIYSNLNPNTSTKMCYRYKHLVDPKLETDWENKQRYTEDPNVVNDCVSVSVRVKSLDYDTRVKVGEYKHMKELHKAYKKRSHS